MQIRFDLDSFLKSLVPGIEKQLTDYLEKRKSEMVAELNQELSQWIAGIGDEVVFTVEVKEVAK